MRRCYRSRWRPYKNRPDIEVSGRYFVVPDDTPAYPGFHPYGSRNWEDGDYQHDVVLGEVRGIPQLYAGNFRLPAEIQLRILGSAQCIELGEGEIPGPRWQPWEQLFDEELPRVSVAVDWPAVTFSWPAVSACYSPGMVDCDTYMAADSDHAAVAGGYCGCDTEYGFADNGTLMMADGDNPAIASVCSVDPGLVSCNMPLLANNQTLSLRNK